MQITLDKDQKKVIVRKTLDFEPTGDGANINWSKTAWEELSQWNKEKCICLTTVKIMYSDTGIYFLFNCQDKRITATFKNDFQDLWKEDVVEVFLWPDEKSVTYFEYEISPLNYELPIMVSNDQGDLVRWQPFHYNGNRRTRHNTSAIGGKKKSDARIDGWIAEFFIPFQLLRPLKNVPPQSGDIWRGNMCRIDYDGGQEEYWSWSRTRKTFHDYEKFGFLVFE